MKEKYHITGMTCSACSSHVEKAVGKLEGVQKVSVNLLTETMDVEYDEPLTAEKIVKAVEHAGYGARKKDGAKETKILENPEKSGDPFWDAKEEQKRLKMQEDLQMKKRMGLSLCFLIPLMYLAMYHMIHSFLHIPVPNFMMKTFHGPENAMAFAMTQFLLLLPILYLNRKFFAVGFKTLLHASPNMDSLIAVGAGAATGYGIFAMYRIGFGLGHGMEELVMRYSHDLYFESAGTILTLITVGKYLEGRSKGKTGDAISKLMDLTPKMAIVQDENGNERKIPTEQLRKGDIFLVKPGNLIPADGIVIEGNSGVDEAAITGESIPVEKSVGDAVISATLNKSGFLKCEATNVGEDTTLARIIRLVEEAGGSKAPIARLADKVAGVFVPVVMCISLGTLLVWLFAGAVLEEALSSAIAVLVISCPCALGLATPVAIMVGTGVGASKGILIKSGEALQGLQNIDTVVLDKTGTVTEGKVRISHVDLFVKEVSADILLGIAGSLERQSEHPLAEAVVEAAKQRNCREYAVTGFEAVFGRGIKGCVEWDETLGPCILYVGNEEFLRENHIPVTEEQKDREINMADEGMSPLWVGITGNGVESTVLGLLGAKDPIKESSGEAVETLKEMGIRVIMLTGDHERTAKAVQKQVGISEVIARVLPQEKEKKIRELQVGGHKVAMIGDGINDAPALVAADSGMAIGAGTDVALESADIVLMKNSLKDAVTAICLGKKVIRNIKGNLFWAFFYNSIGIPIAAGVLYPAFGIRLNPMFGAAAMSLSSLFVVGNALRLKAFKGPFGDETKKKETGKDDPVGENHMIIEERNGQAIVRKERRNIMKKTMKIEGMMCGHCTGRVQKVLEALEGVSAVEMSLEQKTAVVTMENEVSDDALRSAVTDAGYDVVEIC